MKVLVSQNLSNSIWPDYGQDESIWNIDLFIKLKMEIS